MALQFLDSLDITNIAEVFVPAPDGRILRVGDPIPPGYWDAVAGTWSTTPPANIPAGLKVGIMIVAINERSDWSQNMRLTIRLHNPDGSVLKAGVSTITKVAPGALFSFEFIWPTVQAGIHYAYVQLDGEVVLT